MSVAQENINFEMKPFLFVSLREMYGEGDLKASEFPELIRYKFMLFIYFLICRARNILAQSRHLSVGETMKLEMLSVASRLFFDRLALIDLLRSQ